MQRGIWGLVSLVAGLTLVFAAGAQAALPTPGATYTGVFWDSDHQDASASDVGNYPGTLEIEISADGTQVTRFEVTDVETRYGFPDLNSCTPTMDASIPAPLPVEDFGAGLYSFNKADDGGDVRFINAYFYYPNEIAGRVEVRQEQNGANCYTGLPSGPGNIYFTATTGGGCEGSEQYLGLKAKIAKLTAKVKKLKPQFTEAKEAYAAALVKLEKAKKKVKSAKSAKAEAKANAALDKAQVAALDAKHTLNKLKRRLKKAKSALKTAKQALISTCTPPQAPASRPAASVAAAPANDDLINAVDLGPKIELGVKAKGTLTGATTEPNEPAAAGPATVWYRMELKGHIAFAGVCVASDSPMAVSPYLIYTDYGYDFTNAYPTEPFPLDSTGLKPKHLRCPGDPSVQAQLYQFSYGTRFHYFQVSGEAGDFTLHLFEPRSIQICKSAKRKVKKGTKRLKTARAALAEAKDKGAADDEIKKLAKKAKRAKNDLVYAKEYKADACKRSA